MMAIEKKWIGLLLFVLVVQLSSCLHLKYSSPPEAEDTSILAKCRDIEGYLDLFADVQLGGIYTNENGGFKIISSLRNELFFPQARLDFIQLSDVQLCEERAYLFGRLEMKLIDSLVESLRHGQDQEKYDYAVFKSILLGIDSHSRKQPEGRPAFLIHTGDSVHMSLLSELWEFLYIFDRSLKTVPWFNVLGNHDVAVLGTPVSRNKVRLKNPTFSFLPISSNSDGQICDPTNFINFHKAGPVLVSGIPVLGPIKQRSELERFSPGVFDPERTEFHGFDMIPSLFREMTTETEKNRNPHFNDRQEDQPFWKGYYSFDVRLRKKNGSDFPLEKVRILVLNTSEHVSFKAMGGISEEQIKWVKDILDGLPDSKSRVIAFGHHPLIGGEGNMRTDRSFSDRLKRLQKLFEKHVDVYFCGHTHRQSYDDRFGFLQIFGPSLLVFPQSGLKVKIEYGKNDLCVEVVPFSHLEMQNQDVLGQNLDQITALWEKDGQVLEAIKSVVSFWEEESYLKSKDIDEIVSLWESDERVKKLLDEKIKPYKKDAEIKKSLRKAVLLKHAYLGRVGAMEDSRETDYSRLGPNYRFFLPFK
jgi:3',5'-cyclic AMP phosphodiesterase CpdA